MPSLTAILLLLVLCGALRRAVADPCSARPDADAGCPRQSITVTTASVETLMCDQFSGYRIPDGSDMKVSGN